jgi:hypothetical protein
MTMRTTNSNDGVSPSTVEIVGDLRPCGLPKYTAAFSDVSTAPAAQSDGSAAAPPPHPASLDAVCVLSQCLKKPS